MNTPRRRPSWLVIPGLALLFCGMARGQSSPPKPITSPRRVETAEMPDGRKASGKIVADRMGGFGFAPDDGGPAVPLENLGEIAIDGPGPDPTAGPPPFQVVLGPWGRVSGRLVGLDSKALRLDSAATRSTLAIDRKGVLALIQRPGEVQVFRDGFETIDVDRWSQGGTPEAVAEPHAVGSRSLRLPAGGSSLTTRLAEPLGSGRMEVAFHDDGVRAAGQRWFVDLSFRKGNAEVATIRALLGWTEETLAVETPGGPAMNVQPLSRQVGWHRLSVRFDEAKAELSVDGNELAHGKGLGGPLFEVRIATESIGPARPPGDLAAILDDLRLVRFVEPFGKVEIDPTQDELRKVSGDQMFGRVAGADPDRVALEIDGRQVRPPWSEVAGLYFLRQPGASAAIDGLWVRAEWRSAPGDDPRDLDRAEAALRSIDDETVTLDAPYVGLMLLPRDRLRKLQAYPRARRIVIDPMSRHIGDSTKPELDPPQAEGAPVEIAFDLPEIPPGQANLVVDVFQLIGIEGTPSFSDLVKKGQLRTRSTVNGQPMEDWNLRVSPRNEAPERLRLPIPAGALKVGKNVLRIEQTGTTEQPSLRDNFGLVGVALEFPAGPAAGASQP